MGSALFAFTVRLAKTVMVPAFLFVTVGCDVPVGAQVPGAESAAIVIHTTTGSVSGRDAGSGVIAYLGIPYAAPPVGPLRWRPPQPGARWTAVRTANEYGGPCPQARWAGPSPNLTRMSEDCLTLNVWVPRHRPGERLPVMVLIHGGGFFVGSSADGEPSNEVALAAQGVIVASMNYRLGVFGFLSHPDLSKESTSGTSGNYGLLDQIAALSWLKGNVDAFGGDANKVTIFGTSAGGSSVLYLMASPLARGLFNSAIAQSSANVFFPLRYRNRAAFAYEPAEIAGLRLGPNIDALRALSVAELLSRVPPPAIEPAAVQYWPTVDGHVLPEHPADLFERGAAARVPLIVGNTTDEGTLFAALLR
jgi:para-nitrobenzyl esterase